MSSPVPPATAELQLALKHHQAGQLSEAETIYRRILAADPKSFDALRLLGIVHAQRKDLEPAARLLSEAIAIEPRHPVAHFNYANVMRDLGRSDQAIASYDTALSLKPDYLEALNNRGNLLLDLKRFDEALASYDQALRSTGEHPGLLSNRGNALKALGRSEEALDAFERALKVQPNYLEAAYNRANLLAAIGRLDDAVLAYDRVLQLKPNSIDAMIHRANALKRLDRFDETIDAYTRALAVRAESADMSAKQLDVLNNLGALLGFGRREEALACFEQAVSRTPARPSAWSNRGLLLLELDRHNDALKDFEHALRLEPNFAEAWNNRGITLADLARDQEALTSFARALDVRPDYAKARFNAALSYLRLGDFAHGWPAFEWRLRGAFGEVQPEPSLAPEWDGSASLAGKTIVLRTEWGLGDSLQFCRYAKLVKAAGAARVIVEVEKALVALFATLAGVDDVVEKDSPLPPFDFHASLMSLPRAFATRLDTIPAEIPYLRAEPGKVSAWAELIGKRKRPRVGLVWSGGFRPDQPELWAVNRRRNVPLALLAPLAGADVDLFSLQKGEPAESELAALEAKGWSGPAIINLVSKLHDLSETAALIENLDLVITVDTSTAHLAGALGKPVWILNRFDTCWRWMRDRTDSPWYPTARLFRQSSLGDWTPVIAEVAQALSVFGNP